MENANFTSKLHKMQHNHKRSHAQNITQNMSNQTNFSMSQMHCFSLFHVKQTIQLK